MKISTGSTTRQRGRVRVEGGEKHLRVYFGGAVVADTNRPLLVWEKPAYPAYYVSEADVRMELLSPDGGVVHSPSRGDAETFTVRAGGKEAAGAALRYGRSPFEELRDAIRLEWNAMDAWFEEDEQVFTHPRDPYTPRRHPPELAPHQDRDRRGDDRGDDEADAPVRDRPSHALLPPEDACSDGSADAERDGEPLPVQGRGRVLVASRRGWGARRRGLVVPDSAP